MLIRRMWGQRPTVRGRPTEGLRSSTGTGEIARQPDGSYQSFETHPGKLPWARRIGTVCFVVVLIVVAAAVLGVIGCAAARILGFEALLRHLLH